ncbi:MAG TPA: DUF502 domain-containing protein [Syntrophales bacterium]|nr:DUF502 domain-containing protein [Syntrophales bacterium]
MKHKLKNAFLAGLAVTIPVGLTIYILIFLIDLMDGLLRVIPPDYHPDRFLGVRVPGLGVIATVVLIFAAGLLTTSYLGGKFIRFAEALVERIPLVRGIYQAIKQIVQTMVSKEGQSFKRVVLVEFPRPGLYTVAFVTGVAGGELKDKTGGNCINLFVPTTPNPTSGYYVMVPEDGVTDLEMSVEDAFKLIISGGIIAPAENKELRKSENSVKKT